MLGVVALGEVPLGDGGGAMTAAGLADGRPSPHWVLINGLISDSVKIDSLRIDQATRDTQQCAYHLLNPAIIPLVGQVTEVVDQDVTLFGGIIQGVTLVSDQSEAVKDYAIDAKGWEVLTARRLITQEYTDTPAGDILKDLLTLSGSALGDEGILAGVIDDGVTLILADAENVRIADFIRQIGDAGGGAAFVNENKRLTFRPQSIEYGDFIITNDEVEAVERSEVFDNYRNRQTVKVTALDGASSIVITRDDTVEQAARIAQEGGTGIYEAFDEVTHPTSSVSADLNKYGISVAFLKLQALGHSVVRVRVRLRRSLLRLGQIVEVNLPGFAVVGLFQVMRREIEQRGGKLLFTVELWSSSIQQAALESLLLIVDAAKAAVVIPGNVFNNSVTFTASDVWVVPGAGDIEIQIDAIAGGGGGTSGAGLSDASAGVGARGGHGGKVSTFKIYAAGTTLTITIGTNSAGGTYANICPIAQPGVGTDGAAAEVLLAGLSLARAVGGLKATTTGGSNCPRVVGANSGGTGDFVIVGGGAEGGPGGTNTGNGQGGTAASVTIYY